MKKNNFYLALFIISLSFSSFAQKNTTLTRDETNELKLKDCLYRITDCYLGKVKGDSTIDTKTLTNEEVEVSKSISVLRKSTKILNKFEVCDHILYHISYTLDRNYTQSCEELNIATTLFDSLINVKDPKITLLLKEYKNKFDIDLNKVNTYYLNYQKHYGQNCEKKKVKKKKLIKNENSINLSKQSTPKLDKITVIEKATYVDSNGKIENKNAMTLLKELMDRGKLNIENFELIQIREDENSFIKGLQESNKYTQYKVIIKHSEQYSILFFKPREYILDGNEIEEYNSAINRFKEMVLDLLDSYGNYSYEVYLQGSADKPTFDSLLLKPGYDMVDWFKKIPVLEYNKTNNSLSENNVHIGNKYNNNDLPDLRAAFIKYQFNLYRSSFNETDRIKKFHIIKGSVKNITDIKKRDCEIVIAIDWVTAIKYAKEHEKK